MRWLILALFFSNLTINVYSQSGAVGGSVNDESGTPMSYAPVVFLNPADSTMAYFGVTSDKGVFEIKGIKYGKYLLQIAFMGQQTIYRNVTISRPEEDNLGVFRMKSKPISLKEVVVSEEHVPIQFRKDTIEFNTAAFKTKPDAVVEDLLRKLPGLDIDRAGNIKAMGEDIKRVLVDGKEFFGSDPKLATRNVPADALKKVQIFDKKSDESEFTGIDDGTRDKTINLLLKDDRKNAVFGELLGGGGPGDYYQGSAKVYKFTSKNQFAALGMLNNINQFGFSFKDYIDFNGGLQSMGHGGAVQIKLPSGGSSSFPVNFGQPVTGLSTSGAGGFNYSHEYKKDSRIFLSYIGNGSNRDLIQTTSRRNFTDQNTFTQKDSLNENNSDIAQRLNIGWRERIDSTQNLIFNGSFSLSNGQDKNTLNSLVLNSTTQQDRLTTLRNADSRVLSGNMSGSYLKLINRGKTVFRLSADGSFSKDAGNSFWTNETYLSDQPEVITENQFQNNKSSFLDLSVSSSVTRKLGKLFYMEPGLKAGTQTELLNRLQGNPSDGTAYIDSLSPDFSRKYEWFRPGLRFIRNNDKTQFSFMVQIEMEKTSNSLDREKNIEQNHLYFVPELSWEYEYKTGRRLRLYYQSGINVPAINQLLPTINIANPLSVSRGNPYLRPELKNNLSVNWWIFDQFSFTTFLTGINASYTRDKINWNRTVDNNLRQSMFLVNVPSDYSLQSNTDFSAPVRKLGIKINANLEETWNRGLSYVNNIDNINTNYIQRISLSVENRKKTKWDVSAGGAFQVTDSKFSIQKSLSNRYFEISYFTDMNYNPAKNWNFQLSADVVNYNSKAFEKSINIPLIGGEISYYFLKNKRGTITIKGTDLLNRNTGIQRSGDLNFLSETRSNMLGRFFMLSFKYRLNKFGDNSGGIDIKVNKR